MSTGDRLWAIVSAAVCSFYVALFVATSAPINAAGAVFSALMFLGIVLDRSGR